ncbi:right-handed parallel beta-helix repeat-containing protein [Carboxylicivirga marina]|uniref:Right-handed parallel beta-helix repeat-containing protein n=1 Tax=Carboxylicivirga marina TaxID=2800988 RepID=A0ABS1HMV1_9BACT|nr:right-handed parallel beta-helix repeat-containing protein [Carboxylicivirga marina]MBK3519010.1 right-handed parallel beta-helix repeat-containing protein [Carboxylicivirga marina]
MKSNTWYILLLCLLLQIPFSALKAASELHIAVADFGAIPDDGKCDAAAIRQAICSAEGKENIIISFESGVYNLNEDAVLFRENYKAMLFVWGQKNWMLKGAIDEQGNPATTLEMNLRLGNQITGASHLDIRDNENIKVTNFILDQNPRFATAAKVLDISDNDKVIIEVFEGMPHFDGMQTHSANNWDLETGQLIKGPPITIAMTLGEKHVFTKAEGYKRRYEIQSKRFASLLKPGEGLSFHFNVIAGEARTMDVYNNINVELENIFVHNAIGMILGGGSNTNMTFRKVHIKPEGSSLAVGPRDGIHLARNTGRLLMEDVVVKGVRWDPLVSYLGFVSITERIDDQSILLDGQSDKQKLALEAIQPGDYLKFWVGDKPIKNKVVQVLDGKITLADKLAPAVLQGTYFSPEAWYWDEAIIRGCLVESNYGTGLVYECDNLLVEKSIFRNNSYADIGLGPTSKNVGAFCENILIRNNLFEGSTWIDKYKNYRGSITTFHKSPFFDKEPYHQNIHIENNTFKDITGPEKPSAIHIKNASEVVIRQNKYINIDNMVLIEETSTTRIIVKD